MKFNPRRRFKVRPRHVPGVMNKAEAAFERVLRIKKMAGSISNYYFEPMKLKLADKTFFTVDFMVMAEHVELYEVKAWNNKRGEFLAEDDARVKIKVAAALYPEFVFKIVGLGRDGWHYQDVGPAEVLEVHAAAEGGSDLFGQQTQLSEGD